MGGERTDRAQRTRCNVQPSVKQVMPMSTRKSISAAEIFKMAAHRTKKATVTLQSNANKFPTAVEDVSDVKPQILRSRSSSRSPQKAGWKVSKKRLGMHPLAVAFKETSNDYRRHLYRSTTLKINKTLETLLHNLYENTLHTVTSEANGSQDEPLRLTTSAQLERAAQELRQPISTYKVRLTRTDTDGKRSQFIGTLSTRMEDFEDHLEEEKAKIEKLRKEWETIVGEIWKVGVHCLGKEAMESMLFTRPDGHQIPTSPSKVESTLFIPEHSESPPSRKPLNKKHVTFEAPDNAVDLPNSSDMSLAFLYQPTRLRLEPLPVVPAMPKKAITKVHEQIKELGNEEIEEYRKAGRDYQAHWKQKMAQLLKVFTE